MYERDDLRFCVENLLTLRPKVVTKSLLGSGLDATLHAVIEVERSVGSSTSKMVANRARN